MVMTVTFRGIQKDVRPDPRQALVIHGQSPQARMVSDDHGIEFLSFPREIRDNIYAQICVKPNRIGAGSRCTKPFWRDAIAWRNPDFAGTCRTIWNESLRVYLRENGFEFFYIRPFLEFVEKIGIRGRRLLTDVRWHHHARSNPFIVARYLRSCTNLRTLEIFARVRVKGRKYFWYGVPLRHARRFFLDNYTTIGFGQEELFGKSKEGDEVIPDLRLKNEWGDYAEKSLQTLSANLRKVKWEISGEYERPDLPGIFTNGICHWRQVMIEEKKRKRKETKAEQEARKSRKTHDERPEPAQTEGEQGEDVQLLDGLPMNERPDVSLPADEQAEATLSAQQATNDEEVGIDGDQVLQQDVLQDEVDEDDGYVVERGDLVKDGTIVAKGDVFDGEHLLESGAADGALDGQETSAEPAAA